MYNRKKQLKSEAVADELRRKILSGGFPDKRLPRKDELTEYFQVSQKTVEAALKMLTAEGLIRGVKGTGIFVNGELPKDINLTHRLVMVVMPLSGHYYGDFYEGLREELLKTNLYPVSYHKDDSLFRLASVTTFLSAPIKGVLYHGLSYWRNPFLDKWRNLKSVVMDLFDAEGVPPGGAALVDYEAGGYLLAKHFLEQGRRRLVFLHHQLPEDVPMTPEFLKNHMPGLLKNGIRRAIREFGACPLQDHAVNLASGTEPLENILKKRYDGVICVSDHIAYWTGIAAERIGMKYPEDFFLSGCFNTPWSRNTVKPISSLDLNAPEVSRIAVELLNTGSSDIIKIKPRIVRRQSTGGPE